MAKPRIAEKSMERLEKIKKQHEDNRKRYDEFWRQTARFTNPNMADWNNEPSQRRPDDTVHIYDTTVQKASKTLTDGLQGYSFARNQAWFKYALESTGEKDVSFWSSEESMSDEEASWLQAAERHSYSQLQKSNFYDEGRTFVKCCADFGTAVMTRTDDVYRNIPTYRTEHLKWCYVDENPYGEVDVLFREFWLNPYRAAGQFGPDKLPERIKTAYNEGKLTLFKFIQAILPPDRYDLDVPRKKNKPFYSVYWAEGDQKNPIMDGWYNTKPFFVWRWSRNLDGDVWGVDAPGMMELPTVRQLNGERADFSRISQQTARPPLKATEGLKSRIKFQPQGVTFMRPGEDFTPVPVTGNPEPLLNDMAMLKQSINESYYTDFFLILSQNIERQKTATEVDGIQGEKAALLSSFYGRLTSEFLEPVLEDLFSLELLAGRIPVPPESLQSRDLRIDMISPLAQMQKRYLMLGASQQALAEIAALVQMVQDPAVLDNLNFDQQVRNIADAYGLDKRVVRDMADVERMRQARAEQQAALLQQAQQMEQAKVGADIMGKLPKEGGPQ
jgi:hypothetical protein